MDPKINQNDVVKHNGISFLISGHARERFDERFPNLEFKNMLKESVPFGAQKASNGHGGILYLNQEYKVVFACERESKYTVIKTVLSVQQAMSNMERCYLIDDKALEALRDLTKIEEHRFHPIDLENSELKRLALEHVEKNLDRKERNKILRDLGYDTSGESGEVYRRYLKEAHKQQLIKELTSDPS